jgi:hypothetical protein
VRDDTTAAALPSSLVEYLEPTADFHRQPHDGHAAADHFGATSQVPAGLRP